MSVVLCLALGLVVAPGVASADPPWRVPDVPGGWVDEVRGDVCGQRGDPPCEATTTNTTTTPPLGQTSSTGATTTATTTTTDVAGTSATVVTSTTSAATSVAGTTAVSRTSTPVTTTVGARVTTSAVALQVTVPAGAPPAPHVVSSPVDRGLAETGAAPLWTGVGGLAVLLVGALLLLFSRRRRA